MKARAGLTARDRGRSMLARLDIGLRHAAYSFIPVGHTCVSVIALGGRAEAQSRLRLVVLLPALGSQARKVGLAVPCSTRSLGIQPIATNQAGARFRKVLQELDEELYGGEQSGVCVEVLQAGDPSWEPFVPGEAVRVIKERRLFGSGRTR